MTPELTHEQRQAVDEQSGKPVFIVDNERRETFVLLTSSDFDRIRPILGYGSEPAEWNEDKNRRRIALIDRKVSGTITQQELIELAGLQQQAEQHFDQVAPPPLNGVAELHQRLSDRDSE